MAFWCTDGGFNVHTVVLQPKIRGAVSAAGAWILTSPISCMVIEVSPLKGRYTLAAPRICIHSAHYIHIMTNLSVVRSLISRVVNQSK